MQTRWDKKYSMSWKYYLLLSGYGDYQKSPRRVFCNYRKAFNSK